MQTEKKITYRVKMLRAALRTLDAHAAVWTDMRPLTMTDHVAALRAHLTRLESAASTTGAPPGDHDQIADLLREMDQLVRHCGGTTAGDRFVVAWGAARNMSQDESQSGANEVSSGG